MSKKNRVVFIFLCVLFLIFISYFVGYKKGFLAGDRYFSSYPIKTSSGNVRNPAENHTPSNYDGSFLVTHVVDGDTIDIEVSGVKNRIRLLGINTPESVAQNRPIECFGKESAERVKELLINQAVTIKLDPNKPEKDEYGRILAYVWRGDNLFINQALIEEGYAYEYTYHKERYQYQSDFKEAEGRAKKEGMGLWAVTTCNGKR